MAYHRKRYREAMAVLSLPGDRYLTVVSMVVLQEQEIECEVAKPTPSGSP